MQALLGIQRISSGFYRLGLRPFGKLFDGLNYFLFNSSFPGTVRVGKGTVCAYGGIGLVVHGRAEIGQGCVIGQGITIGGRSKKVEVPRIGNNVYLGSGCRILGPVTIGDEVIVGPNAVVLKDVPSGSVVVGIPARVIKSRIKMRDLV
jgi:serine O-acetyltransferase